VLICCSLMIETDRNAAQRKKGRKSMKIAVEAAGRRSVPIDGIPSWIIDVRTRKRTQKSYEVGSVRPAS
jgi:hypothetical protein